MLEWVKTWPDWLQALWFAYVTFHDIIQWGVLFLFGLTLWGKRKHKRDLEKLIEELDHIHAELHTHIAEDSNFHADLGQVGMTEGKSHEAKAE